MRAPDWRGKPHRDELELEVRVDGLTGDEQARLVTCLAPNEGPGVAKIRLKATVGPTDRIATLLPPVRASPGGPTPEGTEVHVAAADTSSVDAFVGGDWLPLSWWEYAPVELGESSETSRA